MRQPRRLLTKKSRIRRWEYAAAILIGVVLAGTNPPTDDTPAWATQSDSHVCEVTTP